MRGEDVIVSKPVVIGRDRLNAPLYGSPDRELVQGVLVAPGPRSDLLATDRPDGTVVRFTLHFPKSYGGDLGDSQVEVRGKPYKVVGDPAPYTMSDTPGNWHMPVEVVDVNG
jgi:hypothetical protein